VIVADVALVTELVEIVKVAPLAFAGTVTLAGVCAAELLADRFMTIPPVGARPVKVTVPVEEFPPTKLVGLKLRVESAGGAMVNFVVCVTPLRLADSVATTEATVGLVVTPNTALLALAGTVTDAGT